MYCSSYWTGTDVVRSIFVPSESAVQVSVKSHAPDAEVVLVSIFLVPSLPCAMTEVVVPLWSITVQGTAGFVPTEDQETIMTFPRVMPDG